MCGLRLALDLVWCEQLLEIRRGMLSKCLE
jgi:hypothetical protein